MQPSHGMHQQHPPPTPHAPGPGPQEPPHSGITMSPRTQSPSLPPSTPTMSDAVPTPQPPLHSHQPSSSISISSPPSTPATSSGPGAHLNAETREIVPDATRQHKTIVIRRADGTEVSLESLKKHSPQPSTAPISPASPITTSCWTASVRIESKKDKRKRQEQVLLEQEEEDAEESEWKLSEQTSRFEEGRRQLMTSWKEDRNNSPSPPFAFTTARKIDSLDEIEYPEGIKGPKAELNKNAKDGKFRYTYVDPNISCMRLMQPLLSSGMTQNFSCNSCRFVERNRRTFFLWTPLASHVSTRCLTRRCVKGLVGIIVRFRPECLRRMPAQPQLALGLPVSNVVFLLTHS